MKKAFTITELLVAVAVLAVTMAAVGGIFKMAIDSQRTAEATSEIMRNLRAITDQINADFKGFRAGPTAAIVFASPDPDLRSDRLVFFANGDFQSTRQYETDSGTCKMVVGNAARIWYGQSSSPDPSSSDQTDKREKLLLRRVQILTSDSTLIDQSECDPYDSGNTREYDVRSLVEWHVFQVLNMPNPDDDPEAFDQWVGRPSVDLEAQPEDYVDFIPMVMAKGVDDFTVQFSGPEGDILNWWPSNQEVRDGNLDYPGSYDAIRFSFTLYDSKGILKGGRRFSHTVYLGD